MKFEDLFNKRLSRLKPGLARVQFASEQLGWLAHRTPSLLVAGTNGKGTTSGFLWRLVARSQPEGVIPCGLFSSPHLLSFAERIRLAGDPILESDLAAAIPEVMNSMEPELWDELSFFEASLLVALHIWQRRTSQLNVLEVGLGGRLDATNIVSPLVSVITSIGLDHCDVLGHSIEAIAFEKAGVMRPGRPLVLGFGGAVGDDAVALRVIAAQAELLGVPLWVKDRDFGHDGHFFWVKAGEARDEARGEARDDRFVLPIPEYFKGAPRFIVDNFSTAAATAFIYFGLPCELLKYRKSKQGTLLTARERLTLAFLGFSDPEGPWPPALGCRFQLVQSRFRTAGMLSDSKQSLLLDVCHNPHGAIRCVEALGSSFADSVPLPGLVSILADKDVGGILDVLQSKLDPIVLFKVANDRTLTLDCIPDRYQHLPVCEDFNSAVELLHKSLHKRPGQDSKKPWVVCGSVIAIGEVLAQVDLEQHQPDDFADAAIAARSQIQLSVLQGCLDLVCGRSLESGVF